MDGRQEWPITKSIPFIDQKLSSDFQAEGVFVIGEVTLPRAGNMGKELENVLVLTTFSQVLLYGFLSPGIEFGMFSVKSPTRHNIFHMINR